MLQPSCLKPPHHSILTTQPEQPLRAPVAGEIECAVWPECNADWPCDAGATGQLQTSDEIIDAHGFPCFEADGDEFRWTPTGRIA